MSSDLIAFLNARIEEDEQAARAATPGPWAALDGGVMSIDDESWPVTSTETDRERGDRVHIARHDPARVLADVETKRRIIEEHLPWSGKQNDDGVYCSTCVGYPIDSRGHIGVTWPCPTLRLLALPYAGHEGYRAEWAPTEEAHRG